MYQKYGNRMETGQDNKSSNLILSVQFPKLVRDFLSHGHVAVQCHPPSFDGVEHASELSHVRWN